MNTLTNSKEHNSSGATLIFASRVRQTSVHCDTHEGYSFSQSLQRTLPVDTFVENGLIVYVDAAEIAASEWNPFSVFVGAR